MAATLVVVTAHAVALMSWPMHGTGTSDPRNAGGLLPHPTTRGAPVWYLKTSDLSSGTSGAPNSTEDADDLTAVHDTVPAQALSLPYVPREWLTVGPQPLEPIVIEYPQELADTGMHQGQLAVYIDEFGVVTQVKTLTPELPPPMAIAARFAFQKARFRPGERDGAAVRTRVVVEVRFDASSPHDAPTPPSDAPPATQLAPDDVLPRS